MPIATYTGVIQAPPEDVLALVADAENNPAWHAHVVETRWVDDGPTGLDRRGREHHAARRPATRSSRHRDDLGAVPEPATRSVEG